jgi:3-dehydroquinate synthetase
LPTGIPAGLDHGRLIDAMRVDKKSRAGSLAFALLKEIGSPAGSEVEGWSVVLEERLVREVLQSSPSE